MLIENLQSLQLHSPFQLVVLDGRIANCHNTAKIITNHSQFYTIVNITIDIANSLILLHFSADTFMLIVISEYLVHSIEHRHCYVPAEGSHRWCFVTFCDHFIQ